MSDPLDRLADWSTPLLQALQPSQQRHLVRAIARDLRRGQAQRIAAQRNPDGSPYEPRKNAIRATKGRIRAQMFRKIKNTAHLKAETNAEGAAVAITGRAARIARIHQEGLRDKVSPRGPTIQYPVRQLLGFTPEDRERVRDQILQYLAGA